MTDMEFDYFEAQRDGASLYVIPYCRKVSEPCYFRAYGIHLLFCPGYPTSEDLEMEFYYMKHPEKCKSGLKSK